MMTAVKVTKGPGGWGGPFTVQETETRKVVASITGGGIHPLAQKIADLLHVPAVDGFKEKVEPDTMIIAVVDCGGTLRCGVYPKLGVKTIDTHPISPSGPLSRYINEGNFVSGVVEENISLVETEETDTTAKTAAKAASEPKAAAAEVPAASSKGMVGFITNSGRAIGNVVNIFYQAGRDSVEIVLKSILPFMVFVSIMVGIINYTGVGNVLANAIKPLAGSLPGLLGLSVFCAIPFLSPVLGPGAVIAQVVGVLLGVQIGKGTIPPSYALPALFAINSQVGCDFLPVALTLAEAEPETVETGVPAMLFSRLITGPIAVLVAFLLSFGLY
ncbi:PTS glucitol/sorbitol transporter subunit IIB [Caproiciproducens faecalis]|uniref:PTS glucitol/sorbitol transporter subunit IIB n=1 Tax=Caproiciproducens faecalis TaxID=2820301 RepID=A0ABS7DJN2_9FIRM|nr:PTS glucitol/sorbitol transporter subunit IIB [Caproiciproducens faecalis]MBW7571488.1 PTS glucitol/sorbitol transporter subunit IIB [Caproiciproducens faecalis]